MSRELGRMDPDFDVLIEECTKQLAIKFPEYGNDWVEQDDKYYKERLMKEVKEYIESMTIESERRKLLNIVNIAAMAYQTAKANRAVRYIPSLCPLCKNPLTIHKIKDGLFICQ